jgi:hypothetical protein
VTFPDRRLGDTVNRRRGKQEGHHGETDLHGAHIVDEFHLF